MAPGGNSDSRPSPYEGVAPSGLNFGGMIGSVRKLPNGDRHMTTAKKSRSGCKEGSDSLRGSTVDGPLLVALGDRSGEVQTRWPSRTLKPQTRAGRSLG